ncbi:KAP family P-loop NTPase fold protein [Clostridium intestinale]|uniref:AAA family ATPase n=1 Tax=Clostridium intestinale TaxID=36845 RepID=A0A7D7A0I1_9CLOT|nr:P-loop NTPase fold protein [Clostridium intestinale]QLY81902.1 AAA family ATPase [Clostridium intestinale]
MEERVYHNKPYELNKDNDLFGTYYKAEAILNVLDNTNSYLESNNIIALYGAWGSGKTSVMDHINRETKKYKCIIFEAWRYENDVDLALSLFELIADKIEIEDSTFIKVIKEVKLSAKTLFCFGKNLILNAEASVFGIKLSLGKSGKDSINEMHDSVSKTSYYSAVNKFNSAFKKLLENYSEKLDKKILIFVDDLDRCEPSKVLDLLSAIKHFFSESKKVVYFCAIDKNAVSQSINVRYNKVITAEEYLEKIFDISFSMPEECNMHTVVKDFYSRIYEEKDIKDINFNLLGDFLKDINFTNPRKIKKIFNKFILLKDLCNSIGKNREMQKSVEYMNRKDEFYVILVLYLIILFEFYKPIFNELLEFKSKFNRRFDKITDINKMPFIRVDNGTTPLDSFLNIDFLDQRLMELDNFGINDLKDVRIRYKFICFILIFYPNDLEKIYIPNLINKKESMPLDEYENNMIRNIMFFNNDIKKSNIEILSNFVVFVTSKMVFVNEKINKSINIKEIIDMVKMYL